MTIPDDLANSKSKDESKDEIWYPKVGDGYRQYKIYRSSKACLKKAEEEDTADKHGYVTFLALSPLY